MGEYTSGSVCLSFSFTRLRKRQLAGKGGEGLVTLLQPSEYRLRGKIVPGRSVGRSDEPHLLYAASRLSLYFSHDPAPAQPSLTGIGALE